MICILDKSGKPLTILLRSGQRDRRGQTWTLARGLITPLLVFIECQLLLSSLFLCLSLSLSLPLPLLLVLLWPRIVMVVCIVFVRLRELWLILNIHLGVREPTAWPPLPPFSIMDGHRSRRVSTRCRLLFLSKDIFWGKICLLSVSCSLANKPSDITRANKCELNWNQKQQERNISQVTFAWMPLALFE